MEQIAKRTDLSINDFVVDRDVKALGTGTDRVHHRGRVAVAIHLGKAAGHILPVVFDCKVGTAELWDLVSDLHGLSGEPEFFSCHLLISFLSSPHSRGVLTQSQVPLSFQLSVFPGGPYTFYNLLIVSDPSFGEDCLPA